MAITKPQPQPYRIDWGSGENIAELNSKLGQKCAEIDESLQILFDNDKTLLENDTELDSDSASLSSTGPIVIIQEIGRDGEDGFVVPGPAGPTGATGATGAAGASASWTTVFKTANTVRHDNTLAADPDLVVALTASKSYAIRLVVHFSSTTAADIKYRHAGPASPTRMFCHRYTRGPDLASVYAMDEAYSASDVAIACLDGVLAGFMQMDFSIVNGVNAGDFAFWWAQNTTQAGDDTTIHAGSYVEYKQLD